MSGIFDQIINYSPPLIVSGTVNYDGTWDASTNTPTLNNPPAASTKGDYYVVSTAGTQFSITFAVGDWIISNGTAWEKVDLTDAVSSVFGRTGAVVGVSTDYSAVGLTNTAIGASSPSTGAFTTVSASTPIAVASGGTGVTTSTGTTNVVLSNSPTLVTPILGTPQSGTLTSCTGLPISTGVSGLGTGIATFLATPSSANLASAVTDETGSGSLVFATSPTLVTPNIGVATGTSLAAALNGSLGATTPSTVAATTGFFSSTLFGGGVTTLRGASVPIANNSGFLIVGSSDAAAADLGGSLGFTANTTSLSNYPMGNISARLIATGAGVYRSYMAFATTDTVGSIAERMRLTDTGLNSTAIGATTPSTGAFTTLSATGAFSFNANGTSTVGPTTGSTILRLRGGNTATADGCSFFVDNGGTVVAAYGNKANILGGAYNATAMLYNLNNLEVTAGGTSTVATFSSTGLAVTGALSSTGILSGPGFRASKVTASSGLVKIQDEGANVYNVIGSRNNADSAALPLVFQGSNFDFAGAVAVTGALSSTTGANFATSSGFVGFGRTNPICVIDGKVAASASNVLAFQVSNDTNTNLEVLLKNNVTTINAGGTGTLVFATESSVTERARITSAGLAVTGQIGNFFTGANGQYAQSQDNTSGANFHVFYNSASVACGSISRVTTTNAVVFNTTSDGRLKENFRDFTDSGRLIDSLKPRVFDWKNSDENGKNVVGFVAQEQHAADPIFAHIGAVSVGDDDPDTITKQWQRSDSALIPILVAELKSLRARVAALES